MSGEPARDDRFPRDGWFFTTSPVASGKFIGAIVALLGIAPLVAATFLGRGLGDVVAMVVLAAAGAAALAGAISLLVRGPYRVLAAFLGALTVGCLIAFWVTATLGW